MGQMNGNQSPAVAPDATLPKMLKEAAAAYGKRVWMREKRSGLWHEYSWQDGYDRVRHFSLGLTSLGFESGQALCVIGDSAPQWFWAEIAAQAAGGFAVGLGPDRSTDDLKAMVRQFGVKLAVAQDREQVEKLLDVKSELPSLSKIMCWNTKDVEYFRDPTIVSFDEISRLGQGLVASHATVFEERLAQGKGSDRAIVQWSSTGGSAAAPHALTHQNLIAASATFVSGEPLRTTDRWFAATYPETTVQQVVGLVGSLASGMSIDCPENRDTARQDLGEIGSTLVCYSSSSWEALVSNVKERIEKTTFTKRVISRLAAPVGSGIANAKLNGRKPNVLLKLAGLLAEFGFYRPLKSRLGLANTRRVYACGTELTSDTMRAMIDMGLDVMQLDASDGTLAIRHRETAGSVRSASRSQP